MAKITPIGGVPVPEYLLVPAGDRPQTRKLSPEELQAELLKNARQIEILNQHIADAHAMLRKYRLALPKADGELRAAIDDAITANEQVIRANEDAVGALIGLNGALRRSNGDLSARLNDLTDQSLREGK